MEELSNFIANHPVAFKRAFSQEIKVDVPEDPQSLVSYVHDFIEDNGAEAEPILKRAIAAMKNPAGASKSIDWTTVINGGLQAAASVFGGGTQNNSSEQVTRLQEAALESQRKTTNAILITIALVIVAVVAYMIIKR